MSSLDASPSETSFGDTPTDPDMEITYEAMEQWLDDHADFVFDYFSRKANRNMVDSWLINHALSQSQSVEIPPGVTHQGSGAQTSEATSTGSNSKTSSGANTPVRKISAQEFEKSGHVLKPMVASVDGTPSFLGSSIDTAHAKVSRKTVSELKALDERELMYELIIDICNDLDVTSLCHKILQNVSLLLNADRCSLFLVRGEKESPSGRCLVSSLFDVTSHSSLQDCTEKTEEIHVPWGSGIVGCVAQTGEPLNIPDAYEDPRFNVEVDTKTGYKTRSILSMPVKSLDGEVVGVAQAINKNSLRDEPFNDHDEKVFSSYLAFCGVGIRNAQLYERSQLENRRNQLLLDLARLIFEEQSDVANLIHKIMMHTQSLLRCERCQVMLVGEASKSVLNALQDAHSDPEVIPDKNKRHFQPPNPKMGVFSQVFDLQASDFENDDSYHRHGGSGPPAKKLKMIDSTQEPRFPINIGITGYVAATGETLNIPDAYTDDRFDSSIDAESDFKTKSILCMPIKNAIGSVIGIAQLMNKLDGTFFNKNDENLFEAFAIFCGMGIHNTQMYEKAVRAMAKQRVALEVLSYHASAPLEEVHRLRKLTVPSAQSFKLFEVTFDDFQLSDDETLKACLRMFLELDLIEKFHINYEVFCRWLLSVKKNYRNVKYHNWRHAFNVAQTMFWMITQGQMWTTLDDLECLALLVGCLCHDLDHRGTNNQFQIKTMSPLAQLYSTSVLEHHHFDQCIMILNTKGNELFSNIGQDEYERTIKILEKAILATDLALYFRFRGEFLNLVDSGKMDPNQEGHRDLLRSMMMTACDVAAISKPWEIQKRVAELVAGEFFEQGDIEKEELKIKPMDMMDRDKKDQLPTMQVGFIDSICVPVYQALTTVNERLNPLLVGCQLNRDHWAHLVNPGPKDHTNKEASKKSADEQDREKSNKDDEEVDSQKRQEEQKDVGH